MSSKNAHNHFLLSQIKHLEIKFEQIHQVGSSINSWFQAIKMKPIFLVDMSWRHVKSCEYVSYLDIAVNFIFQ